MASNKIVQNKNTAKRTPVSAVFRFQADLPAVAESDFLPDGAHTIGFIEGNIAVTKVGIIVREAFDGTAPTVSVTDSSGGSWYTAAPLGVLGVDASAGVTPVYYPGKTEFNIDFTSTGSTHGTCYVVVDYIQLDTELGCHTAQDL